MIDAGLVSAVLVTRGDQPLDEITASIRAAGIEDIVVWNNRERPNMGCYGRYLAIAEARRPYIFHQDDDLLAPVARLLQAYDPVADRHSIVANNPLDEHWQLTGRGAVFYRSLADCFAPYTAKHGDGPAFRRVADVVFAYQHPYRRVDLGHTDLPWASAPDASMYLEPGHYTAREQARANVKLLMEA